MAIDEKMNLDEKQETTSSVDETKPDEYVREDEKTPSGESPVPRWRVKELTDSNKALREDIEVFKQQQKKIDEENQAEPLDWKEAENRAVSKAVSKMEKKAQKIADARNKQDQMIERSFKQLKAIGQEITPAIEKVVMTELIKSGSNDVFGTYLKIKKQATKTEKTEQQKKEGFVPSSQKGSAAGQSGLSYKELRATSLDALVERASKKSN